jgi:hypothetical protein
VVSKLDLVVVVAVIGGGMLWLENRHRVVVEPPIHPELTQVGATACPDSDTVPYSASCLAFLKGGRDTDARWRIRAADSKLAAVAAAPDPAEPGSVGPAAPCPANDNMPYSASCVAFLSGWFWHSN